VANEIRQPDPANYPYGQMKNVPSAQGLPAFPDTFIGPRDKAFHDFHARDRVRLRGMDSFYYVKMDHPNRIDGQDGTPLSISEKAKQDALARRAHAGMALYGEQVKVGKRLDSVRREVTPDWAYDNPILVRGIPYDMEHEYEAGDRGGTYIRRLKFDLARVSCDEEWKIAPMPGDLVHIPGLFGPETDVGDKPRRGYFDVKDVNTDQSRVGSTGFFVAYQLVLTRTTRYPPERKLPPKKTTSEEELKERST